MTDRHGMCSHFTYRFLTALVRVFFRLTHPVVRVIGRENLPSGPAVLCANHSHLTDPIWILGFGRFDRHPRIMAKKELFSNRLFRWFFAKLGAFPVDRGNTDIRAIKEALATLKEDNKLLIFPEGTRVRQGQASQPHSGAVLLAHKVKAPIVPVYLSVKKGLFRPISLIFGEPTVSDFGGVKPDASALEARSLQIMSQIYELGEEQ